MKYIPFFLFIWSFGVNAQKVDSCEEIRLKWAITAGTGEVMPDLTQEQMKQIGVGQNGRYIYYEAPGKTVYHFPNSRKMVQQTKVQLWANTTVFQFHGYQVNNLKLAGWAGLAFAGAVDGIVEGYEFDGRTSFERKYQVQKSGYFGSESWQRAYKNGNVEQGYKNRITQSLGAQDFYHHADDVRKLGYISGGIAVGISGTQTNTKWWHYLIDFGIGFAISGATKAAGMYWIRN
jgi:hypothetical protein